MERSVLPVDVTLTPVAEPDFPVLRKLAETIWRQHYSAIISAAQIAYTLSGCSSDEALREHVQGADRWLKLLQVSGEPVGYCGYELAGMDDDGIAAAATKLGQLFVLESTAAWASAGTCSGTSKTGRVNWAAGDYGYRSTRTIPGRSDATGRRASRSYETPCSRSAAAS
jgi:hypothetical protein